MISPATYALRNSLWVSAILYFAGRIGCGFLSAAWLAMAVPTLAADIPNIAASADMTLALKEIAGSFSNQTNKKVKLTFGSSGVLAQQIAEGAPIEMFLSADEANVISLAQRSKAMDDGKVYGIGRIVVFMPRRNKQSPVAGNLTRLRAALEQGKIKRLAVTNPDLCPYGRATREALLDAGLWSDLGDRLLMTEDIGEAAELALTGKVDAAILPLSLAVSPLATSRGTFAVVEVKAHRPLKQRMVLVAAAGETARAFYAYMQAPVAREVLRRYGYTFPLD